MKVDIASEAVQVRDISYIKIDKVLQRGRKYYKLTLMVKKYIGTRWNILQKSRKRNCLKKEARKVKENFLKKKASKWSIQDVNPI